MAHPLAHEQWSDEQLLAGIAGQDPLAFSALYKRHLPLVLSFLLGQTKEPETAADLTAEVFASAMIAAPRYVATRQSAAPWLLGIAKNVLGTSRRRGRVDDRARRKLGLQPLAFEDSDLERVDELAAAGRISELADALPEAEREAVRARVVEERSYAEIATELRCSELVVRKRVSRGLARLRAQLEEN